jgi:riboflavin kinase/FMN adenylyltransferase
LVIGYNHHFGHNKSGDYAYLLANGGTLRVTEVEQQLVDTHKVSSTIIRQTIERGDMALAAQLTGHPYIIIGKTDDEGRVAVDRYKLLPADGIYNCTICGKASQCEVRGGELFQQDYFSQQIVIEL